MKHINLNLSDDSYSLLVSSIAYARQDQIECFRESGLPDPEVAIYDSLLEKIQAGVRTIDTPKQRVEVELLELRDRLEKLINFIHSDKFSELSDAMQRALVTQRSSMNLYATQLCTRLLIWEN